MTDHRMILAVVLGTICMLATVQSCNELVCGSIVSKCMLTQSCKCEKINGKLGCLDKCTQCLSYLYTECCSCLDMCPKPNHTRNALSKKSHVGELEVIQGLFSALTESDPDGNDVNADKWSIVNFPVDLDSTAYEKNEDYKYYIKSTDTSDPKFIERKDIVTVNCTVAYMAQCMSLTKCQESCSSMGASSYRWFHDGCCECVGTTCINYGINESRCLECPEKKISDGNDNTLDGIPNEDDLDYGEGMQSIEPVGREF